MNNLPTSPTAIDDGGATRQLQSPYDRHSKLPNPKLAYDDPSTVPKVVDPSENYNGNDSDPTDEDPVVDNNDNDDAVDNDDDDDNDDNDDAVDNDDNDDDDDDAVPTLPSVDYNDDDAIDPPTSAPSGVDVDNSEGNSSDVGGLEGGTIVTCDYTAGGVFVGGVGGRNDIEADARVLTSVIAYDYEIDSDPPRVDILGMGGESTELALNLILDREVVPEIEEEVTKCVVEKLFEECNDKDRGEGESPRRQMTSTAHLEKMHRDLAIVGVGKDQDDQLEFFGSCMPAVPDHLCDIVNGEMKLFHTDASTIEQEKIDALVAIKKCLESDQLLETIQANHGDIKDIRFKPIGEDVPGDGRIEKPIGGTPPEPMSATPFIAVGASMLVILALLVGYRRYAADDEEDEEENSDEESNLENDDIYVDKEVPGAVGLSDSSKPPALNFDKLTVQDMQDSVFTPAGDQSTAMTFDSTEIASKTPNASTFQPTDTNLLDIPESESGLDLLNTNTGSMDFGSGTLA